MAQASLDAVGLIVADLGRAIRFYRALGVPFADGAEDSEHGHADVVLDNGVRFMLDTEKEIRSFDSGWQPASGDPRASLAFNCGSTDAVDEVFRTALDAGGTAHKEPWDAFWGQRYAQLRDPDGNGVDLYANRAA